MTNYVEAQTLKSWLSDGREIALIDVREPGQFGERHPLFAVPAPYSVFENRLGTLVPNKRVRMVLCDEGDGIAERAAGRAMAMGYGNVHVLGGGVAAWEKAGYTLYAGVNVPSKAFGELIEIERGTPRVSADRLKQMIDAGEKLVIVDGRPYEEFQRMSIPGGHCCPNGELALRIDAVVPDPDTTIVVNCAGRTRSIIGAQTLIDLDIPNQVVALENGTQGWSLAGLELDRGAAKRFTTDAEPADGTGRQARACHLAEARGARIVDGAEVAAWLADDTRTTYVIDIRSDEEVAGDGSANLIHALGGQLVQATDRWVGVRGARVVLVDTEMIRAPVIAAWLRQLGHEAYVLAGGVNAVKSLALDETAVAQRPALPAIEAGGLKRLLAEGTAQIVDLRPSMVYRQGHLPEALWSIRPQVTGLGLDPALPLVLVAEGRATAELAAIDIAEAGFGDIRLLSGGVQEWQAASLPLVATPDAPADDECIDFLFFTHRRTQGDAEHSRQYLAWEIGLVDQLDEAERASFRIVPPSGS